MMFMLLLDCDGAGFDENPAPETARILREVADALDGGGTSTDTHPLPSAIAAQLRPLRDRNGEDVGQAAYWRYSDVRVPEGVEVP